MQQVWSILYDTIPQQLGLKESIKGPVVIEVKY